TLKSMLANPQNHYVNLHSTVNPGGVIRGQLQRVSEEVVLMGAMSSNNEVPPIAGLNASGMATIHAYRTRDGAGNMTSGLVTFDIAYNFPDPVTFTGLHVHTSPAGVNGPVTIGTSIGGGVNSVPAAPGGSGTLFYPVELNMANQASLDAFNGLFTNPAGYYANLHTTVNGGGAIRSQLRRADRMVFQANMLPSNEVPAIAGLEAQGVAAVTVNSIRNPDGTIAVARVVFDVNHRFPDRTEFTGLHIHDGPASANGGVTVGTDLSGTNAVVSETGFGNISRVVLVTGGNGLATLNSLIQNPERHYVNLHTRVNPGGAVRTQMAAAAAGNPAINAVVSSVLEPTRTSTAPAGLVTIFGSNLARVQGDLVGFDSDSWPTTLNGVKVTIGGREAPLQYVGGGQINVQTPVDVPAGSQPVIVTAGGVASAPSNITAAAAAPAIFVAQGRAIAVVLPEFELIRPDYRAAPGDAILIYATGLGQATPALQTGKIVPLTPISSVSGVTVTIGGRDAEVISAVASPTFVGLYQIAARVPTGVTAGEAPVVIRVGQAASNAANISVRQ
ncbi:MAG: CHRD domain-containing protein, partial [Bryobacteraceae bacterium]